MPPHEPAEGASADPWLDAGNGYSLGLRDGRVVARNAKGKVLASVPRELREGDVHARLTDALERLESHAAECREHVETWMLRSLPVPRAVLQAVWADEAWRGLLENAVIAGAGASGLLRAVDPARGLGVVTLDGDTTWLGDEAVRVPHPILLDELDEWRAMLGQLALTQGLSQLFRETFVKAGIDAEDHTVDQWSGAEFDLLATALNEARRAGWRVRAGAACCATWEGGRLVEARYDLGEGDPMVETTTGSLYWVDPEGRTLPLGEVGPVAWSEGMRMAAALHAKRKVEDNTDEDA